MILGSAPKKQPCSENLSDVRSAELQFRVSNARIMVVQSGDLNGWDAELKFRAANVRALPSPSG
jgi:hypothetical protein